jgi:NodT family efflux transporter outer membrane factor (OMF) lipoprotein
MTPCSRLAAVCALSGMSLTAACAAAPQYAPPKVAVPATYKESVPAGADVLQPAQPRDAVSRAGWWEIFGDGRLNDLEKQLMTANPAIGEAEARVRQARALVRQDRASYYPIVTANVSAARTRSGGTARPDIANTTLDEYALNFGATWEADLWGRVRETVNAGTASAEATVGDLESIRLTLGAELAADYFQLRSADAELALFDQTIEAYQRAATLTSNQYNAGIVSRADVEQADTQLASAQAQAVDLRLQRVQLEHAIAVLLGQLPANVSLPSIPLEGHPPQVPLDLPSRILERRPDVAAAERRVAAANAQIGVASAAFFPSLILNASGGFQSTRLQQWLSWPTRFWSLGPALALTVFDAGERRAVKAQAVASYDEAVATYRQTVLSAFQDVEDNLAAVRLLGDEAERQEAAVSAAQRSLDISLNQYRAGTASYLQVSTQQTALLTNQRTGLAVSQRQFVAAVQLVRALGGSWNGSLNVN